MSLEKILNIGLGIALAGNFLLYEPAYSQVPRQLKTKEDIEKLNKWEIEQQNSIWEYTVFERILIRGVGAPTNEDISEYNDYFDTIINLSQGNRLQDIAWDLIKANADRQGRPVTQKDLSQVKDITSNVYDVYAHSWGCEALYNALRNGSITPARIVLINPPSLDVTRWDILSEKTGIRIDMYLGTKDLIKAPPAVIDFIKNPVDYLMGLGLLGGKPKNVSIHTYNGWHNLKDALVYMDSKFEFATKPSERIARENLVSYSEDNPSSGPTRYPTNPNWDFDGMRRKVDSYFK